MSDEMPREICDTCREPISNHDPLCAYAMTDVLTEQETAYQDGDVDWYEERLEAVDRQSKEAEARIAELEEVVSICRGCMTVGSCPTELLQRIDALLNNAEEQQ